MDERKVIVFNALKIDLKAFYEHESSCTHKLIPGDNRTFCHSDLVQSSAPAVGEGEGINIRQSPDGHVQVSLFMLFGSFPQQPSKVYFSIPIWQIK